MLEFWDLWPCLGGADTDAFGKGLLVCPLLRPLDRIGGESSDTLDWSSGMSSGGSAF